MPSISYKTPMQSVMGCNIHHCHSLADQEHPTIRRSSHQGAARYFTHPLMAAARTDPMMRCWSPALHTRSVQSRIQRFDPLVTDSLVHCT